MRLYRPALIQSSEAMKCLLDSMLVLTKQDRLCHVIHATSDPFYQTWLRQLNVMQHCKACTILLFFKLKRQLIHTCDRLSPLAIAPRQRRWSTTVNVYCLVCQNVYRRHYISRNCLKPLVANWRIGTTTLRITVSMSAFAALRNLVD